MRGCGHGSSIREHSRFRTRGGLLVNCWFHGRFLWHYQPQWEALNFIKLLF